MKMNVMKIFMSRLLLLTLLVVVSGGQARAWDMQPGADGLYDGLYDRPTHFPEWRQPAAWPNAMYYLCDVHFGAPDGPQVPSYEIAVFDQNDVLRHCNRSLPESNNLCMLTIRGEEGDIFHFKVIYGDDFDNPTIIDVPNTSVEFSTNAAVGTPTEPYMLILPGRTYLRETDTELPASKTGVDVTVIRTINANEWGTICLPFAMTEEQVKTAFGEDVLLGDFKGCDVTYEDDEETVKSIQVKFDAVTAIEANHPYIIKVSADISEFEADGVDINAEEASVDRDRIGKGTKKDPYKWNSFIGNYVNGFTIPEQCLFLGGGNFWYSAGRTPLMAFRAYFDFYDVLPEAEAGEAGVRMAISFNGDTPTGVGAMENGQWTMDNGAGALYDMQGRHIGRVTSPCGPLKGAELRRGIYICNGRKFIIK